VTMGLIFERRRVERLGIIGFGVTGRATVEFSLSRGVPPIVSEARSLTPSERGWLAERGVRFEERGHTPSFLADADVLVLSPGVPPGILPLDEARKSGVPVVSEIDLAGSLIDPPIVAVTGTNGKSTVATLIGAILESAGKDVVVAGNIGIPAISIVDEVSSADAVVLEVSSYQLEQSLHFHPQVAILLNLAPDHLSRHGTMDAYAAAKGRIFRRQTPADAAILPSDLAPAFDRGEGRRIFFDRERFTLPPYLESLPPHNRENLRAAISAARALLPDIDPASIPEDAVRSAVSLPHRLEVIGEVDGVRVIDDSKSTNPAAAIAALRAVDGPVVLLIGGRSKGAGYDALAREVKAHRVRRVVAYGEAADELSSIFSRAGVEIDRAADLERGISIGVYAARPGDTLLFSPACSSFDRFRDFAERGDVFTRYVEGLPGFSRMAGEGNPG